MEIILILLAVAILLVAYFGLVSKWKPVQTASGSAAEELEAKYALLKEHRIKCRLKSESTMSAGVIPVGSASQAPLMRLYVKEKDLQRALEILEEFEQSKGILL